MHMLVLLLVGAALSLHASAADIPLAVEDSGSKEVDKLVLQLVSSRPAPYPSGSSQMLAQADWEVPYMTPEVTTAISKLKAMGTSIFPALVKHLRDDRYSYSDISAAWLNFTVGNAVTDVFSDGYDMVPGYKFRETPKGLVPYLSFRAYLDERDPSKWAAWAQSRSRVDIRLDFIDWCVSKEKERGFTDEAQRKGTLARYVEAREEAKKMYSGPHHGADGSHRLGSFTNREPSAADPHH